MNTENKSNLARRLGSLIFYVFTLAPVTLFVGMLLGIGFGIGYSVYTHIISHLLR